MNPGPERTELNKMLQQAWDENDRLRKRLQENTVNDYTPYDKETLIQLLKDRDIQIKTLLDDVARLHRMLGLDPPQALTPAKIEGE